ncbi:MAG: hypothetical protein J6I41_05270 [Bacteroidales bacterium]|nr:hypothetical protein [Bacteroidales bacterium]
MKKDCNILTKLVLLLIFVMSALKKLWLFRAYSSGSCMGDNLIPAVEGFEVRSGVSKLQYIWGRRYGVGVLPVEVSHQRVVVVCH